MNALATHHWNEAPGEPVPEGLPLQTPLPRIRAERGAALVEWAAAQPAVRPWLLKRQFAYWDAVEYPPELARSDALHQQIDAVVALDLLRWQSGCLDNRKIIERWADLQGAARELSTTDGHE